MAYIIIILLLIAAVSFTAVKLWLIKRQLKEMKGQMEAQAEGFVSVDFVDRDVEAVAMKINGLLGELQKVRAEAVKGEQALKASVSMISHDMRTPLTSVIGYLQLARKACREGEVLKNIDIALERAEYSGRLIDDFFELSVADSGSYAPVMEKVNLCEAVCEEILGSYPEFEKKGITPLFGQADDAIWVWADRKMLARVIQNLISNGLKYSSGKMLFEVTEGEKITLFVSNSVLDSVSGAIDPERIFDRLYRADSSRNSEGTGLGLYICRKMTEGMNGHIGASCSDGRLVVKIELVPYGLGQSSFSSQT